MYSLKNISSNVIDPRKSWNSNAEWEIKAKELAQLFINNFQKFSFPYPKNLLSTF